MKHSGWHKPVFIVLIVIGFTGCSGEMDDDNGNITKVSINNSFESHNDGQVCQNCHSPGGGGDGVFTAAGTVYEMNNLTVTYPNTTIHLYTQPNGQGSLVMSIEVDGRGNFYTTRDINWGMGLYPAVTSQLGTLYMQASTDRGDCNGCHNNVDESRIFAN